MAIRFFYISVIITWIVFLICSAKKRLALRHTLIAITGMGYSLLFETLLGEYAGLYYYISKSSSLLYIILSAVLLYPEIEVLYCFFLPKDTDPAILYTIVWTVFLLTFEFASLYTGTVVITGWKVFPWSVITYLFTFLWINILYRLLKKRGL